MTAPLPRRRALRILGAALALPLGALALRATRGAPAPVRWQGEALGALSAMTLWHPSPVAAERALTRMLVEIDRLDRVFSLYRADSEIRHLNATGNLAAPTRDLVRVLDESRRIAQASAGAFDPTVQPLWTLHAAGRDDPRALDRARALVDHAALNSSPRAIRLGRPGMQITLNGIAQGYITDRITELLGNEGFETAMIELGETRALGTGPGGAPFPVGLARPDAPGTVGRDVALADAALSVSGGYGMRFGPGRHHIFDPATGHSANRLAQVAVVAPKAMRADALSTAIYVAGEAAAPALLATTPGARAVLTRTDGTSVDL